MSNLALNAKLESLPPELRKEVSDFIDFLILKTIKKKQKPTPKFGSAKGKIKLSKDFDEPIEDFKDYM